MNSEIEKRIEESNKETINGHFLGRYLAENKRCLNVTRTGDKKEVQAFIQIYNNQLQLTFRYGKEFYTFAIVDAKEDEKAYNRMVNFKGTSAKAYHEKAIK